jgi:hypothetical protein
MTTKVLISSILLCIIICYTSFSQSGESKFKRVILNENEKKVSPLFPSFTISKLSFSEANMNRQLEGNETGTIKFLLKNTGTIVLQKITVNLNLTNNAKGIIFTSNQILNEINVNDSALISFQLSGDENIKDGLAKFSILVQDANSDSLKMAQLDVQTREISKSPMFTWITPETSIIMTDFSVYNIAGVINTKSNISGLKLYLNDKVVNDSKTFDVIATERQNEYRIRRNITLSEGDNEIRIEAKNSEGVSLSESRTVRYFVQRFDQKYVERRLALVIGNSDYINSNPLQNPVNDAKAIAEALKEVGFTVMLYLNSDLKTMKQAMDEFGIKLPEYSVGLFYYAGHGMQVKGNNYLIPVDASLKVEQDVDYDCIDAGRLLGKMEAGGTSTNIVILDACRDNPFERSWAARAAAQGGSGLAFMNAPSGSIIAYATSPGKTASDGTGKNGLYTEAILQYIKVPSLSIEDFFKSVRVAVEKKSNRAQTPWESTSLKGNFYFTIK